MVLKLIDANTLMSASYDDHGLPLKSPGCKEGARMRSVGIVVDRVEGCERQGDQEGPSDLDRILPPEEVGVLCRPIHPRGRQSRVLCQVEDELDENGDHDAKGIGL